MSDKKDIVVTRDCEVIQIPYGNTMTLREGTQARLMHQLGDTFTIRTETGYLVRVSGKDADALGLELIVSPALQKMQKNPDAALNDDVLWDQLKTCYDPEIPANIVDLGLIYECIASPLEHQKGYKVDVKMTLTAPGCGMGQVLKDDVERKLYEVPGVSQVDVELVFQPPWDSSMMSESARLQLGMM